MKRCSTIIAAVATLVGALWVADAHACEEYVSHEIEELKEYRDKLREPNADPFDRLYAFEQLICASNPTLRAFAVREGLRSASDPIVRHQILLDSMMQMKRLDIELTAGRNATKADKEYVNARSGILALQIPYASAEEGCLSLDHRNKCLLQRSVFIRGDNVKLTYDNLIGEFRLGDGAELIGFIRVLNQPQHGRIPAVIKLN